MKNLFLLTLLVPGISFANCISEYRELADKGSGLSVGVNGAISSTGAVVGGILILATDGLALLPMTTTAHITEGNMEKEKIAYKKIVDIINESSLNESGGLNVLDLSQHLSKRLDRDVQPKEVVAVVRALNKSRSLCTPNTLTLNEFISLLAEELS